MTPEGKVKSAIMKWLHSKGFLKMGTGPKTWPAPPLGCYYMPVSNGMGIHGIPDFICVYQGKALFIEAKKPGAVESGLTPNQINRHEEIRTAGGFVVTVDSVEMLDELFEEWVR